LDQLVAKRRGAEKQPALATGFNERYRPAILARQLGELHVAADFAFAPVDDVPAARLGRFDNQPVQ